MTITKTDPILKLPVMLNSRQREDLIRLAGSSHHESEGGEEEELRPGDRLFRADKPYRLLWLAELIYAHLPSIDLGSERSCGVDPNMQIYRLSEGRGAVSRHVDQDFTTEDGSSALYSILIYLSSGYVGGETVFNGSERAPDVEEGAGLLFKHDVPHEGLVVLGGEKYILKTDLLFRNSLGTK